MSHHLQAPLLPHTEAALRTKVLKDLRLGQSTADSIAGRLEVPTVIIEQICDALVADRLADLLTVSDVLIVYRATMRGIETITPS